MPSPSQSLRTFMSGLIDYAGLFPPASLTLVEALGHFRSYATGEGSWMMSRFIIPASVLSDVPAGATGLDHLSTDDSFGVSVLGTVIDTPGQLYESVESDVALICGFRNNYEAPPPLDVFEVKLPPGICSNLVALESASNLLMENGLRPFFELSEGLSGTMVDALVERLREMNSPRQHSEAAGLKVRCGGVTAEAFPPVPELAHALSVCRNETVPFKATAGLHHPLRHYNETIGTSMHGFINVFGAGILARTCDLSEDAVEEILLERDSANFSFDENSFRWASFEASLEDIRTSRVNGFISFGSCSFDEPRKDLHDLGWL